MSVVRTLRTPRRVRQASQAPLAKAAEPKVKVDPSVRKTEKFQVHNSQYDGMYDKAISTNKRFESVSAFTTWFEKVKTKQSMLKLYKDYKVEQLADGGVLVYRDLDDNGKYEADVDRLVAVNGASVRTVKPDFQKAAGTKGMSVKSYEKQRRTEIRDGKMTAHGLISKFVSLALKNQRAIREQISSMSAHDKLSQYQSTSSYVYGWLKVAVLAAMHDWYVSQGNDMPPDELEDGFKTTSKSPMDAKW
jgi:hypothetical protein